MSKRYQQATQIFVLETIAGIVQDNRTLRRIAKRLSRSFNTTGSKSTPDQWEKRLASGYDFQDILIQLQFFGALCVDEYVPRGEGRYDGGWN